MFNGETSNLEIVNSARFACKHLINSGYKIIERNYRTKWDELDVIAKAKDGTLVFVEVKNSTNTSDGLVPERQYDTGEVARSAGLAAFCGPKDRTD